MTQHVKRDDAIRRLPRKESARLVYAALFDSGRYTARTVPQIIAWIAEHEGQTVNHHQVWAGINYIRRNDKGDYPLENVVTNNHAERSTHQLLSKEEGSRELVKHHVEKNLLTQGAQFLTAYCYVCVAMRYQGVEDLHFLRDAIERVIQEIYQVLPDTSAERYADQVVTQSAIALQPIVLRQRRASVSSVIADGVENPVANLG